MLKIGDRIEGKPRPRALEGDDTRRRWCVGRTEARREDLAEKSIRGLGFLVYVPRFKITVRDWRRRHRGMIEVERPLFRGYLFTRLDQEADPWGSVQSARGMKELLHTDRKLKFVPDALVEQMMQREGLNFNISRRGEPFKRGEVVQVQDGPFAWFFGAVATIDDNHRITVLLDLLGRKVPVQFESGQVERT